MTIVTDSYAIFDLKAFDDEIKEWCKINISSYRVIEDKRLELHCIMIKKDEATLFRLFWNDNIEDMEIFLMPEKFATKFAKTVDNT